MTRLTKAMIAYNTRPWEHAPPFATTAPSMPFVTFIDLALRQVEADIASWDQDVTIAHAEAARFSTRRLRRAVEMLAAKIGLDEPEIEPTCPRYTRVDSIPPVTGVHRYYRCGLPLPCPVHG